MHDQNFVIVGGAPPAGWFWQIPLQGKDGCGYVYASDFLSEMEAVAEFQQFLKHTYHMSVGKCDIDPVRFCTGKRAYAWQLSLQEVLERWTSRREIKGGDIFTVPNWFTLLVGQGYKLSMLS